MFYPKRIAALKYLIAQNKTVQPIAKRVLWFLLDQSQGLTKEVCLTLTEGEGFTAEEIKKASSMDAINSSNSTTHFDAVMTAAGTRFTFSIHYGHFEGREFVTTGQFNGPKMPLRYTIWLAKKMYSSTAEQVSVSRDDLNTIDLSKPGLYKFLENQPKSA